MREWEGGAGTETGTSNERSCDVGFESMADVHESSIISVFDIVLVCGREGLTGGPVQDHASA